MGACSQCKVTPGRDWTYTIYQPFQTNLTANMKANDDEVQMLSSKSAAVAVGVDGSTLLFRVAEGGEAGLMQDLGCMGSPKYYPPGASATTDACNFTKPWFRKRLTDLGRGKRTHAATLTTLDLQDVSDCLCLCLQAAVTQSGSAA